MNSSSSSSQSGRLDPLAHQGRATQLVAAFGTVLLSTALLLPVGDAPWFSFWREWAAAIAVLLIVLGLVGTLRDLQIPLRFRVRSLPTLAIGLAVLCWVQLATGLLHNHADALMPSVYLLGFALCGVVAESLPASEREALADRLAMAMLGAALLSVPLAVLQWIGWLRLDLGLPVAGGRPIAHMEQANLLCSLLIQGVFGAWRLAERRRLGMRLGMALGVALLATIALTQSRVAWLVSAAILGVLVWRRDAVRWRSHGRVALAATALLAIGTLALPWIDAHYGLAGAGLSERTSEGRRPAVWALFLDAIAKKPWAGWGALQNGPAQYALAGEHPSLGYFFSSAHNIALDLMVWFGAPIGLFAAAMLLLAVLRRIARAPDAATLATVLAATALVLHAMVELPLQYVYFLLPLGLYLGLTTPRATDSQPALRLSTRAKLLVPALSLVPGLFLAVLPGEYLHITDVRPVLAIDDATKHLLLTATLPLPDVVLLDQLRGFHMLAATPLQPGLTRAQLDAARTAMLRSPYAASIERYALLTGINGVEPEAREALARICKFEPPNNCVGSRRAWAIWREHWPQLPTWPSETSAN